MVWMKSIKYWMLSLWMLQRAAMGCIGTGSKLAASRMHLVPC